MRISQEDKAKLRIKILDDALPTLKSMGAGGAPVDKIMKRLGLTSGALYSHFESKDDFFVQVVLHELDRLIKEYGARLEADGPKALAQFVDRYLSLEHVKSVGEGCVFAALGSDMHRQKPTARQAFEEKLETLFDVLAGGIADGSKKERIAKARFVYSSMIGAMTYARTVRSDEMAEDILRSTKKQIAEFLKA